MYFSKVMITKFNQYSMFKLQVIFVFLLCSHFSISQEKLSLFGNEFDHSFSIEKRNVITNAILGKKKGCQIIVENSKQKYSWVSFDYQRKLDFTHYEKLTAEIKNTSDEPLQIMLWIVGDNGWNAVGKMEQFLPGEKKVITCDIRSAFPDGTPKIDPANVKKIELMLIKAKKEASIVLESFSLSGNTSKFHKKEDRLLIPELEIEKPAAGKRVKYLLPQQIDEKLYAALYLPKNWNPSKKHPVIVEFPGNIYFTEGCYSTGKPESCVIGYGMSEGENAIWLSMPFVNYEKEGTVVSGWGKADDTVDYTQKMIENIIKNYGGDRENLVVTGFSRGAIACGFIGLRNKKIGNIWKGIHACQHYDGDGWGGSKMEDAIKRLKNFEGKSFFQTDNSKNEEPKKMLKNAKVKTTFVNSGLKAHGCDMFLDNRPSTLKLRNWFRELVLK